MTINSGQTAASHPQANQAAADSGVSTVPTITFVSTATKCSQSVGGTYSNVKVTIKNDHAPYLIKIFGSSFSVKGTAVAKCAG